MAANKFIPLHTNNNERQTVTERSRKIPLPGNPQTPPPPTPFSSIAVYKSPEDVKYILPLSIYPINTLVKINILSPLDKMRAITIQSIRARFLIFLTAVFAASDHEHLKVC